ncbi:MAG: glycoside hydrolase family 13 protein, partial [Phaeodactylibacter sp.]|nr:glycoside hydrolase family 13 protein [Phaeodactylibacter sp.]
ARVEPPCWWVGMAHPTVELLIYDKDIRDFEPSLQHPGVQILEVTRLQNPNYQFILLEVSPGAQVGTFEIFFKKAGVPERTINYELKARHFSPDTRQGLTSADFIYLLMPDRFANGDPSNDSFADMNQVGINRDKMYFRHGGDLKGIQDRLDYFVELGATALWLNPVLENDEHYESYHGYAVTDHYQIDKRFGSNEAYVAFVEACHAKGLKVVMDIIHNHVGDQHWFIQDLPDEDWIHQFDNYLQTTYRAPTLMDPYASRDDRKRMSDGWFDRHMPDLNQQHPQLANYLIQNNIWWVEYTGQDAYRIDTYAYPDQAFMADWGKRMQREYSDFNFFGETWVHGMGVQSQFTQNNELRKDYNSYLPGITDFQVYYAINDALNVPQGWTEGVARLYFTLAQDFLYEDPYRNVIFLDNHDLSRFYSVIGEDVRKFKSGITMLLTLRGIPMLYYGTEIGMKNFTDPDGKVRGDFPGGWTADPVNKFKATGRSAAENEVWNYVSTLATYRKETPALQNGRLTQFVPEDGFYAYFRYDAEKTVMVVMNLHPEARSLKTDRFQEFLAGYTHAVDIPTGRSYTALSTLNLAPYEALVLELKH